MRPPPASISSSPAGVIPCIDVGSLFGEDCPERRAADHAIHQAAADIGFIQIRGLPDFVRLSPAQLKPLKRIFGLAPAELRALWRQKFAPEHRNVYRGWFPLQPGHATYKEGIDMGPDIAYGAARVADDDPLREPTPLPSDALLPGWRAAVAAYYRSLEHTGRTLMRSIARGLELPERAFDADFEDGISTLRLIRYPAREVTEALSGVAHVDSGILTLLAQDGVGGLQAKNRTGSWIDIPAADDALAVNFGRLLELWTGGDIRATEHRVLSTGRERYSIPFFYEPGVDAQIAPLKGSAFSPFLYGDFVWASATQFVEFSGLQHLRPARGGALPISIRSA
jgi:isopenicillin N synthase-like dioxygenase